MLHEEETIYKFSGENECEYEYILRGLRDWEVGPWAEFCASVFSYKSNPPPSEYFFRHYANDPTTRAEGSSKLIRVAIFEGTIVASCRIFLREISAGKKGASVLRAGGFGEVCTDTNHRRRGISTRLLSNAISIMEDEAFNLQVSSLHAAPVFFPLYESMGYSAPHVENPRGGNRWSVVDCSWDTTTANEGNISKWKVRPAKFPWDTDRLQEMHAKYSEERMMGCILRSREYWNDYLRWELEGSLFVLTLESNLGLANPILAWLSLKKGNGESKPSYCVQEFGANPSLLQQHNESISMGLAMGCLVAHAVKKLEGSAFWKEINNTSRAIVSLKLPGFVVDDIRSSEPADSSVWFDWDSEHTEIDRGWMYRDLGNGGGDGVGSSTTLTEEFLDFIRGSNNSGDDSSDDEPKEHFVWPSDSF
jgi:GNAT superfamily N-acetyltransferase